MFPRRRSPTPVELTQAVDGILVDRHAKEVIRAIESNTASHKISEIGDSFRHSAV